MNELALISVIIPVYNVEKYLTHCVQSVLNQTYQNLEIILINDGSTDGSGELCDSLSVLDDRIQVYHRNNQGVAAARNYGLSVAHGTWVTFLDSDDYIKNKCIEHLYEAAKTTGSDLSVCSYQMTVSMEEDQISGPVNQTELVSTGLAIARILEQQDFDVSPWGKLYKKSLFTSVRFPTVKFEDLATTYQLFALTNRVAFIASKDYFYVQRVDNTTNSQFSLDKLIAVTHIEKIIDFVKKNYPDAYRSARTREFSIVSNLYLNIDPTDQVASVLWDKIKTGRYSVLLDSKARPKTRLAALISCFGKAIYLWSYKMMKSRERIRR